MPKDYTADKIINLELKVVFSTQAQPVAKPIDPDTIEYYAAYQEIRCTARNGTMSVPVEIAKKYYGAPKSEPWTAKEVGNAMKDFNNMNTVVYNDIKQIYLDAISEDIS
ncbi:MAG TPA: hypothetical protein VMZ04_04470 [Anaerolineae bacterium]|nr:hypothetical protein [Anaerolineae bacterium]